MKRFRKALGIVALALVVSLSLAMPVSAWADESESYGKPDVSGPQSAWYNGQSHHFRSTVCKGPRFLNGKRSESSGPAEPVLDWAASVQASLDAHVVVPVDVLL